MAESLKDQLLKVGLITEEQAEKAAQKKHRGGGRNSHAQRKRRAKPTRARNNENKTSDGDVSLSKAYALRSKVERQQAADEARKKAEDLKRRQEANRKMKKLIADASLNDKEATERRNYMYGSKIRHVYVTEAQQEGLVSGELGIIVYAGRAHIVNKQHYAEVEKIKPESAVFLAVEGGDDDAVT
ncbi:MAG: hypothetical protein DHS20C11_17760 [Lysobacteraceae bacterium]|nr:MAG: hypothetical protein DHS20C11_17760 [Xanthomonadaceae bacterium]